MPARCLLVCIILVGSLAADEVVRRDGTRTTGTLAFKDGQFTLGSESIANIDRVRFTARAGTLPTLLPQRVQLLTGDSFVAELVRLDATHLHVRTTWGLLALPRTTVEHVAPLHGPPLLYETFTADLSAWKVMGNAKPARGVLTLTTDGQQLEHSCPQLLEAGVLRVDCLPQRTKTRRGLLELEFARDTVLVEWCGPGEHLTVTTTLKSDVVGKILRDATIQRLGIEWDRHGLTIVVREQVLWSGPTAGELRRVRLRATGEGEEPATLSGVMLGGTAIPTPQPFADLTRDGVRSTTGDELFGAHSELISTGVVFVAKHGKQTHTWPTVRELSWQRGPFTAKTTSGEQVRVRLRSIGSMRDVLRGVVTAWDAKTLTLLHPVLGELALPRTAVEEVQCLYFGVRQPITTTPFHLGTRSAFGYAIPKPEGISLSKTLTLENVPEQVTLATELAHVDPQGPTLALHINGQKVDLLNRHVDRRSSRAQTLRLSLAAKFWQRGDNTLELRWQPTATSDGPGTDGRSLWAEWLTSR